MITYIIMLQNGKTINAVGNKEKVKALKENQGSKVSGKIRDDSNNPPVVRPAPMVAPVAEPIVVEDKPEEKPIEAPVAEPIVVEEKVEEKKPPVKKKRTYTKKKTTVKKKTPVKKKTATKKKAPVKKVVEREDKETAPKEGSYEWFVSKDKK